MVPWGNLAHILGTAALAHSSYSGEIHRDELSLSGEYFYDLLVFYCFFYTSLDRVHKKINLNQLNIKYL